MSELYEREKRESSIVIRNINTDNADEIVDSFGGICEMLGQTHSNDSTNKNNAQNTCNIK